MATQASYRGSAAIDGGPFVRTSLMDTPQMTNSSGATINCDGKRLTGAGNAASLTDLTTRADLENYLAGALSVKGPVRAANTTTDAATVLTGLMGASWARPYEVRPDSFTVLLPDVAGNTNSAYFTLYGSLGFVKFYMHVTGFADSPPAASGNDRVVPVSYAAGASAATIASAISTVVNDDVEFTSNVTTSTTVNVQNSIATLTSNPANNTTNMTAVLVGFTSAMSIGTAILSGYGATLTGKATGGVLSLDGLSPFTVNDAVLVQGMVEQRNVWTFVSAGGANYVVGGIGTYILMRDYDVTNGGSLYVYFKNNTAGTDPAPSGSPTPVSLGFVETNPGGSPLTADQIAAAVAALIPSARYTIVASTNTVSTNTKGLISNAALTSLVDTALGANVTLVTTNYYTHNGVYSVTNIGAVTPTQWVLTRTVGFDGTPSNEVVGGATFLQTEGATNSGKQWMLTGSATKVLESASASGDLVFSLVGTSAATYQPPVTYVHKVTSASGGNITTANAHELRNLNFATSVNAGLIYNSQTPDGTKFMLGLLPGTYRIDCSQTFANVGSVVCYLIMNTTNASNAAFLSGASVLFQSQPIATDTGITDGVVVDYNGDVTIPSPGRYVALSYVCTNKPAADGLGPINAGSATIGDGTTPNVSYYAQLRVTLVSGTGLGSTIAFNSAADVNPLAGSGLVNGAVPRYNTSTQKWEPSAILNDFDGGIPKEIVIVKQIPSTGAGNVYPSISAGSWQTYPMNALEIFNGYPGTTYLTNAGSFGRISDFTSTGGADSDTTVRNPNTTALTSTAGNTFILANGTYNIRFMATIGSNTQGTNGTFMARIYDGTNARLISDMLNQVANYTTGTYKSATVHGEGQITVVGGPTSFTLQVWHDLAHDTFASPTNTGTYFAAARVVIEPIPVNVGHTHRLVDLGDVAYTAGPFDGDGLAYNESVGKWQQSSNAGGDVVVYELDVGNPSAGNDANGQVIPFASGEALTSTANSGMSAPTSGVFTCQKAGVYRVVAELFINNDVAITTFGFLVKNFTTGTLRAPTGSASIWGSQVFRGFDLAATPDKFSACIVAAIPLAVNDTVRAAFAADGGSPGYVVRSLSGVDKTRISIERVQSTASISFGPAAFGQLQDVSINAAATGDRLMRNGSGQWINRAPQHWVLYDNATISGTGTGLFSTATLSPSPQSKKIAVQFTVAPAVNVSTGIVGVFVYCGPLGTNADPQILNLQVYVVSTHHGTVTGTGIATITPGATTIVSVYGANSNSTLNSNGPANCRVWEL